MAKKIPDLVDIIEQRKLPTKPKRSGYSSIDQIDNTPPSQWDEIGLPKVGDQEDITEAEINQLLKEARLKLIARIHQERKKKTKKTSS
jgi:hypothetical protein